MMLNMVWISEPHYEQSLMVEVSFVMQAMLTGVIFGYLKSKSLAAKTVMDLVNMTFLAFLLAAAFWKVIMIVASET